MAGNHTAVRLRLTVLLICSTYFGLQIKAEPLPQELARRATHEGLALIRIGGTPLMILSLDGGRNFASNPRGLSSAWLTLGGVAVVWSIYYHQPPYTCSSPMIIEAPYGTERWRLPGSVINAVAGVSPDGQSLAFFGTYKPPGSGNLNTQENRAKWVTGLQYAGRQSAVRLILGGPTPSFGTERERGYPVSSISWSPNNHAFTYDYQGKVYIYDLASKTSIQIASGSDPEWSPNGRWIAFRSPESVASAIDPVTHQTADLFGHRKIFSGVHWSPDSRYVMLSEKLSFFSNLLHFQDPFLTGVMLAIRLEDGASAPLGWIGPESPGDKGYSWVSDYRTFLKNAAVKPSVTGCE